MLRLVLALVALAPIVALAPASEAECFPAADSTATEAGAFYLKVWGRTTRFVQTWQEDNGIPGLQLDSGMACGGRADRLVLTLCVGTGGCVLL